MNTWTPVIVLGGTVILAATCLAISAWLDERANSRWNDRTDRP